ncbi:substrate-binding periplasmic protein [Salidesulfovibrio onnuriiensis]|uniref:substrate-binding periplasmic protein n=1 Tax=Salidesulfovibrio onnuriiensis TaxID=2583823 RepID=UPI0011CB3FA7|nr:transporter substrate-binding domain-containing protein [Salidesulfovibrio onnuriiensis]
MKRTILFTAVALLVLSFPAFGQDTISFATVDWQPYAGEYLPEYGVGSAIIAEACRRVGLKASFHFMPWKRAMDDVARGKYDALYSAYYSEERARTYALSRPYIHGQLVLCARKGNRLKWDGTIRSLAPYRLGVVLGYVNTPEFDGADYLQKDVAPSDLLNLSKLLNDRLDAVVIDKFQAIYLLKNSCTLPGSVNDVDFLFPPLDEKDIYVMFSKELPGWENRLERFNKGLEMIEADCVKDKIMMKFGFIEPENPKEQGMVKKSCD